MMCSNLILKIFEEKKSIYNKRSLDQKKKLLQQYAAVNLVVSKKTLHQIIMITENLEKLCEIT